jgi:hypothetical protein
MAVVKRSGWPNPRMQPSAFGVRDRTMQRQAQLVFLTGGGAFGPGAHPAHQDELPDLWSVTREPLHMAA